MRLTLRPMRSAKRSLTRLGSSTTRPETMAIIYSNAMPPMIGMEIS